MCRFAKFISKLTEYLRKMDDMQSSTWLPAGLHASHLESNGHADSLVKNIHATLPSVDDDEVVV